MDNQLKKDAMRAGIRVFLQKPFAVGVVKKAIEPVA
jgi:FixJ family two-component response regulator